MQGIKIVADFQSGFAAGIPDRLRTGAVNYTVDVSTRSTLSGNNHPAQGCPDGHS